MQRLIYSSIFLLLLFTSFSWGISFPEALFQTHSISVEDLPSVTAVFYGNSIYGYYQATDFTRKSDQLTLKFLPPGYKLPLKFYVESIQNHKKNRIYKGEKKFDSPLPASFQSRFAGEKLKGSLDAPFYLLAGKWGQVPLEHEFIFRVESWFLKLSSLILGRQPSAPCFPYIVNKLGEVVWLHTPSVQKNSRKTLLRPLTIGKYGVLRIFGEGKSSSFLFSIVDAKGKVSELIDGKGEGHHDFLFLPKDGLYVLLKESRVFPWKGVPANFLGDVIVKVGKENEKVVWNAFDFFSPETDETWVRHPSRALELEEFIGQIGPSVQSHLPDRETYNYTHLNSLQWLPNRGFLLGFKNTRKVALLDPSFKNILSTLGESKDNTIQIKEVRAQFSHQHQVTLLTDNRVLIFDNGEKQNRILELRIEEESKTAHFIKEFVPSEDLHSRILGAAFELRTKNILGFFVSNENSGLQNSRLIEFDSKTGKEKGSLLLFTQSDRACERVYPLEALADPVALSGFIQAESQ